jgi:hypothetical protein
MSRFSRLARSAVLVVALCSTGCFTQAVWERGQYNWHFSELESIRVSAQGDVCIIFACGARRGDKELAGYRRCLLIPEREIAAPVPGIREHYELAASPSRYMLPPGAWTKTFDEAVIAEQTAGWREVPFVVVAPRWGEFEFGDGPPAGATAEELRAWADGAGDRWEARQAEKEKRADEARNAGLAVLDDLSLGIPWGDGNRFELRMPYGQEAASPGSKVGRILLTPPAVVADVITSPFQIAFLIFWATCVHL